MRCFLLVMIETGLPNNWQNILDIDINISYINKCMEIINEKRSKGIEIYPTNKNIFRAFKKCEYQQTKVVIFGQDPYHQFGIADGLAFSSGVESKVPASLQNIFKEIENDIGFIHNTKSNLDSWAKQGVLLLNTSLSVEHGKPNSHRNIGWSNLINAVIKSLSNKGKVVFMLWGNEAKKNDALIDCKKNYVLRSSHPSPLSAHVSFFGCKHFSMANKYLKANNINTINW